MMSKTMYFSSLSTFLFANTALAAPLPGGTQAAQPDTSTADSAPPADASTKDTSSAKPADSSASAGSAQSKYADDLAAFLEAYPSTDSTYNQVRNSDSSCLYLGEGADERDVNIGSQTVKLYPSSLLVAITADGTLGCKLPESIPEGTTIYALAWVPAAWTSYYSVDFKSGETTSRIRGDWGDAATAAGVFKGLSAGQPAGAWTTVTKSEPIKNVSDVTISVTSKKLGINESHKLSVDSLIRVNISLAGLGGGSETSYSIADGKVEESTTKFPVHYYVGLSAYPFAWHSNHTSDGKRTTSYGRYFSHSRDSWIQSVGITAGVSVDEPLGRAYLGLSLPVPIRAVSPDFCGLTVTAGWQPHLIEVLPTGVAVGDTMTGDNLAVDHEWELAAWGLGLSVDSAIVKSIASLVK